jgi:hypothetical protein
VTVGVSSVPHESSPVRVVPGDVPSFTLRVPCVDCDVPSVTFDVHSTTCDVPSVTFDAHSMTCDVPSVTFDVHSTTCDVPSVTFDVHSMTCDVRIITFDAYVVPSDASDGTRAAVERTSHVPRRTLNVPKGTPHVPRGTLNPNMRGADVLHGSRLAFARTHGANGRTPWTSPRTARPKLRRGMAKTGTPSLNGRTSHRLVRRDLVMTGTPRAIRGTCSGTSRTSPRRSWATRTQVVPKDVCALLAVSANQMVRLFETRIAGARAVGGRLATLIAKRLHARLGRGAARVVDAYRSCGTTRWIRWRAPLSAIPRREVGRLGADAAGTGIRARTAASRRRSPRGRRNGG